jgi:hypothetical protein
MTVNAETNQKQINVCIRAPQVIDGGNNVNTDNNIGQVDTNVDGQVGTNVDGQVNDPNAPATQGTGGGLRNRVLNQDNNTNVSEQDQVNTNVSEQVDTNNTNVNTQVTDNSVNTAQGSVV